MPSAVCATNRRAHEESPTISSEALSLTLRREGRCVGKAYAEVFVVDYLLAAFFKEVPVAPGVAVPEPGIFGA